MKWILGSAFILSAVKFYGVVIQFLSQFSAPTYIALSLSALVLGITVKLAYAMCKKEADKVSRFRRAIVRSGLQQDIKQLNKPRKQAQSLRPVHLGGTTYYL